MTAHVRHPWLKRAKHLFFAVFLVAVVVLLVRAAQSIDWSAVWSALRAYDATTIALGLALAAASYFLYTGYDVAARSYAGHHVPVRKVMLISLIAYAFALNIGALVGGTGFRFRMYLREGEPVGRIARVVAFCVATNWIGYTALGGVLFASGAVHWPPEIRIGGWIGSGIGLQLLGYAMIAAIFLYLLACHVTHGRVFHVRGHHFRLPSPKLALLQIALAAGNWMLMGLVVATFLPQPGEALVLAALLLGAIAAGLAHIPAGLGVLEAVYIGLLGHVVPEEQIIAALLAYRFCYYLVPLLVATLTFAVLELSGRPARGRALR